MGFLDKMLGRKAPAATRQPRARAQYLRDGGSGILNMRRAVTRDGADAVRDSAERASALAWDFVRNSGWIAGAVDQIITDTVGSELKLQARPYLATLGYDDKERTEWIGLVEQAWFRYAWSPKEYDLAGKATLAEHCDGVVRYYLAGGEAVGVIDYMSKGQRNRYGVKTGTKVSLVAPHRLKRETSEYVGLDQGIFHDNNGRPIGYRLIGRENGQDFDYDLPSWNGPIRRVIHVMDRGDNPDSARGISVLAPVLRVAAQYDQLADATLTTALLQTAFAATINSPEASEEAFKAIQTLEDDGETELAEDLYGVWEQRIDALKSGGISMSDHGKINHLGPGETFEMHTAGTPGSQYIPFSQNLQREMARRLGITAESFTFDFSGSTYSSVRMGIASIWPIVIRRRERIVAPFCQSVYEAWLDEMIATGVVPFKGGYAAFAANRELVTNAEWPGPAQPTADDYKSAMAAKLRIELGLSSMEDEAMLMGRDAAATRQKIAAEIEDMEARNIPVPFGRSMGGGGGPMGAAMPGRSAPAADGTVDGGPGNG
ncbi:MAG: phage portal protein [Cypionkella sp.]